DVHVSTPKGPNGVHKHNGSISTVLMAREVVMPRRRSTALVGARSATGPPPPGGGTPRSPRGRRAGGDAAAGGPCAPASRDPRGQPPRDLPPPFHHRASSITADSLGLLDRYRVGQPWITRGSLRRGVRAVAGPAVRSGRCVRTLDGPRRDIV